MRNLVLCLGLIACNDDNLMGGMSDMTVINDLTPIIDMAMRMPDGVVCGNQTCNGAMICCVKPGMGGTTASCGAPGSCGDGGAELMCDGPEDCPASTHNCCATAKFSLGAADAMPMAQGADAACGDDATCAAGVDLNAGELHTKLCHTANDCVGYSGAVPLLGSADFDGCCTSTMAPGIQFCAPTMFMTFMGRQLYTCQ